MNQKILKIELGLIFLITIVSTIGYFYQDQLPDNVLWISSSNDSISAISYFFSSVVTLSGFLTGPWILIPFIIFSLMYAFVFSRRDFAADSLSVVALVLATLSAFYFVDQSFIGAGLKYYLNLYFSNFAAASVLLFSLMSLFYICLREKSFDYVSLCLSSLSSLPAILYRGTMHGFRQLKKIKFKTPELSNPLKKIEFKTPKALGTFNQNDEEKKERQTFSFKKPTRDTTSQPNEELAKPAMKIASASNDMSDHKEGEDREQAIDKIEKEVERAPQKRIAQEEYDQMVSGLQMPSEKIQQGSPDEDYFQGIIEKIEAKLEEFNIVGHIINILKGPVVDTYELDLGPGVKISKVTSITDDLKMALNGAPVRLVYPMPERTTVGIEVPRMPREFIYLTDALSSQEFQQNSFRLPIAMGKNAFGEHLVVDLAKMPHMLVAGATGAGKSVFINTLLMSLLVKLSPKELNLILIDPKQLELALYHKLPHLVLPVLTDAKSAAISLLWAVQEMERRYSILKEFAVKNIDGFNKKIKKATPELLNKIHQHYDNDPDQNGYELPYLVIIIDEFADLVLTKAGKEIELNVSRLAAKARAAGIHLVVATQRPSVDVITGVIKSNFPVRVAFRVTTGHDSKTILDSYGAEQLLGKGDMLYRNGVNLVRAHSSFIEEDEVEVFTDQLASLPTGFNEGAMDFLENGGEESPKDDYAFGSHIASVASGSDGDELFEQAAQICIEMGGASASMLQRKLKIGYNRAANLIDELEEKGIVGPAQGSKLRKVLVQSAD